jgi:NADH-quinone oxidoreductase subunit I
MKNALKEIYGGLKSLLIGMRITLGQFFKPTVTVQYPHETLKIPPRFRGHIELVSDPETGKPLCIACKLCERACPSDCIVVDGAKLDGAKRKSVTKYVLDFTKCSLCGACVEACHDDAIRFSREYNLASLSREEYVMDLLKRLEDDTGYQVPSSPPAQSATPAAQPVAAAPQPAVTLGAAPVAVAPAPEPQKVETR